jgi:hypothetical protein
MVFPVRVPLASSRIRYGMVLFVAIVIVILSVINPATIGGESADNEEMTYSYGPFGIEYGPLGQIRSNRWAHGMGYALFTATLAYAFVVSDEQSESDRLVRASSNGAPVRTGRRKRLALCVCIAVGLGICMELVQAPLPYRGASVFEVLINTIGACLMAAVWGLLRQAVRFGDWDEVPN